MTLLSVAQVGALTHRHPETVRAALGDGSLHGYQSKRKAPWVVEEDCAVAWRTGKPCSHQTEAVAA